VSLAAYSGENMECNISVNHRVGSKEISVGSCSFTRGTTILIKFSKSNADMNTNIFETFTILNLQLI
jgi:hypothetical protein